MKLLKFWFRYVFSQFTFLYGYISYLAIGQTKLKSFQAMINVFCVDRGKTHDLYLAAHRLISKPYFIPSATGIFGKLDSSKIENIRIELETKGYSVSEHLISEDFCSKIDELTAKIISQPFRNSAGEAIPKKQFFDSKNLISSRYSFLCEDLINESIIQEIMADESLLAIANTYFQTKPSLDSVILSMSTDYSSVPSAEAAQMYHFDMDRLKWLKFFIYLTDVNEENGPHVFVDGTHKTGGIPKKLLKRGYSRIEDYEVDELFSKEKIKEFKCQRGTLFVEDTRGLHKGKALIKGKRLLLQIQYNVGFFGSNENTNFHIKGPLNQNLCATYKKYPKVFSNFKFNTIN